MSLRLLMVARVTRSVRLGPSVRSLTFAPVHRSTFPGFRGGEHVQLELPDGRRRDYSLCGSRSNASEYEVAVLQRHDGRGGSRWIHEGLGVGDQVFVSYPLPGMTIERGARRHIFVAGGIGITAIVGLLQDLPRTQPAKSTTACGLGPTPCWSTVYTSPDCRCTYTVRMRAAASMPPTC
jgi:ferredoxin-NADP reductase